MKTGHLLGADPRRQFVAQALGIATGATASTLAYFLLVPDASVFTEVAHGAASFPAPGAQQWKAVAEVMQRGLASLHPMSRQAIGWGCALGVVLSALELVVPKAHRRWVPSPIGLGLGFVLPFYYPLAMFVGALLGEVASRSNKAWASRYLVPLAAGGVAGESVVGVAVQALNNFVLST